MSDISQALIQRVEAARASATPLSIVGGASKHFMGRKIEAEELGVAEHSGVVAYEPSELVITARAGTTISEIEQVLAEQGQFFSFEPPQYAGQATLGGTLACNQSGPARPWGGAMRDAVLGIRLINGKAEHLRFGGQVMKNVAGYDISRLQSGALGTLGIITEISIKAVPKAAASVTVVYEMSERDALSKMNDLGGKAKPITGCCWLDNKLYVRLAGAEAAVFGTARQWGGETLEDAQVFWSQLREQQLSFFTSEQPLWRFSIRASAPPIACDAPTLIDWGGSQRWVCGEFDKQEMEQHAHAAGGHVALFRHGDRSGEVFHSVSKPLQDIHKRLKSALDPNAIFNPGRLYSWL